MEGGGEGGGHPNAWDNKSGPENNSEPSPRPQFPQGEGFTVPKRLCCWSGKNTLQKI